MTCRLDRMDSLDALYLTARNYPGGVDALAQRLGVHVITLYKKLERNTTTHHLRWDEGEDIMRFAAQAGVADPYMALRALAWQLGHVCVPVPDADAVGGELAAKVVKIFEEGGDVAREIQVACSDGKIDRKELGRLEDELAQLMGATASLLQAVRQEAAK